MSNLYLQNILKPVYECLKEEGHNFLLMICLRNGSKLKGLKNVNANSKQKNKNKKTLVFVITLGRQDYFSKYTTISGNSEKPKLLYI